MSNLHYIVPLHVRVQSSREGLSSLYSPHNPCTAYFLCTGLCTKRHHIICDTFYFMHTNAEGKYAARLSAPSKCFPTQFSVFYLFLHKMNCKATNFFFHIDCNKFSVLYHSRILYKLNIFHRR